MDSIGGTGVPGALVVGARHHPGELALDPVEIHQTERRLVQLTGRELLGDQLLDGFAHPLRRSVVEDADAEVTVLIPRYTINQQVSGGHGG